MSNYGLWNKEDVPDPHMKTALSSEWTLKSPRSSPRSSSPPPSSRAGEAIFNKYNDLINSRTNMTTDAKQVIEPLEKPFDFFDDEEFAFGINLLKNNVACVGENITKLIQM
ncbi:jg26659, partial [Pararge aegeria aegeria]